MFRRVPSAVQFPEIEEEVLAFWKAARIYEKSLERREGGPRFVFYEGPPTANGLPHPGHCLTRAIKDLFPRYRTMRGYFCERKGGWDTHGLPVEVEVCKELGIHSKEEIEAFGIEPFIHKCQTSVWRYMQEWERLTERLGFWIHLDEAYATYHQSYVDSVWWSLKNLFDRGLLYQGHKIVWWWAQGGTALSSGEVGEGYREVADPSVYVCFPLVDDPQTALLVWTTTPWTLPSNQFVAVHPQLEYVRVLDPATGQKLILAAELLEPLTGKVKRELLLEQRLRGEQLVGMRYVPPFDFYYAELGERRGPLREGGAETLGWRVLPGEFVTIDTGTGIVHQAPAFGEVDYELLVRDQQRFVAGEGPELLCAVAPDGKFTEVAGALAGRWVKEADRDICRDLRARGLLFHQEQYLHDYPFCPRAEEDPLIQYPRRSWFIRTSQFKDRMLENNRRIGWLPEYIRDGRFGNFLESNVDWALSRERYWGTPLPIWVCSRTGRMEAVGSYAELLAKPGVAGEQVWQQAKAAHPELPDDLRIHKPYIDAISYDSPFEPGGRMQRVPEVIDCWYDAGAMPFAQWGYPHQGRESFQTQFPADFISEALDQTRGWFYSLLAISTLVFGDEQPQSNAPRHPFPHPFRNCIVLGLMLGEDGAKMSKRKRNYREPQEIFDRYGADALRWYLLANQAPWTSIRYSEAAIKESIPEFLLRLWNVYSFFVIYANIDGFSPADQLAHAAGTSAASQLTFRQFEGARHCRPVRERGELDRWIIGELQGTVAGVIERMDRYDNFAAAQSLGEFVDALSNWYVRRSRDRFWSGETEDPAKQDAYWTLYQCLVTTSKLIAPFVPFLAETMWRNLALEGAGATVESVHLCDFPEPLGEMVDEQLSIRMRLLREIASLGRSARMEAKLKVRQPLAAVEVILADSTHQPWLEDHDALLRDELNVKRIEYTKEAERYITFRILPNFKRLGPRLGKRLPVVKQLLAGADGGAMLAQLKEAGRVVLEVEGQRIELDHEDVQVRLQAREGWAAAQGAQCVVVLSTALTDALIREGWARDLVRLIQDRRKQLQCEFTDRIEIGIVTESADLQKAVHEHRQYILDETLGRNLQLAAMDDTEPVEHSLAGAKLDLFVRRCEEA